MTFKATLHSETKVERFLNAGTATYCSLFKFSEITHQSTVRT